MGFLATTVVRELSARQLLICLREASSTYLSSLRASGMAEVDGID